MKKYKNHISIDDMNYIKIDGIIEFPITIMDTYLFSYLGVTVEDILDIFQETISTVTSKNEYDNIKVITLLWHDTVLKLIGGRMYKNILEYLTSKNNIKIMRGIDLVNMINKVDKN